MPQLRVGAEFWTVRETANGVTEAQYFLGPSVSWATSKFWLQLGAGFGSVTNRRARPSCVRSWINL